MTFGHAVADAVRSMGLSVTVTGFQDPERSYSRVGLLVDGLGDLLKGREPLDQYNEIDHLFAAVIKAVHDNYNFVGQTFVDETPIAAIGAGDPGTFDETSKRAYYGKPDLREYRSSRSDQHAFFSPRNADTFRTWLDDQLSTKIENIVFAGRLIDKIRFRFLRWAVVPRDFHAATHPMSESDE
jgi:hypothetical protein